MKQMKREQTVMKNTQEIMLQEICSIKERQRIDGINIAKILEKQNETFALIIKQNEKEESKSCKTKNVKKNAPNLKLLK